MACSMCIKSLTWVELGVSIAVIGERPLCFHSEIGMREASFAFLIRLSKQKEILHKDNLLSNPYICFLCTDIQRIHCFRGWSVKAGSKWKPKLWPKTGPSKATWRSSCAFLFYLYWLKVIILLNILERGKKKGGQPRFSAVRNTE